MLRLGNNRARLIVTSECNIDCFYCHNEGQAKGVDYISPDFVAALAEALSQSQVTEVTISGGEPLLHPELLDIAGAMRAVTPKLTMVTNGILLDRATLDNLAWVGVDKIRLGIDSLRPGKSRPSRGLTASFFAPSELISEIRARGMGCDLNVVLTRFNHSEIGALLILAVENGLNAKFFEHVQVRTHGASGGEAHMNPRPQVPEQAFVSAAQSVLGSGLFLGPTPEFGTANLAARFGNSEIRYCRYLCPYGLCWVTGTRFDATGYVYTCMSKRGGVRVSSRPTLESLRDACDLAVRSGCGS